MNSTQSKETVVLMDTKTTGGGYTLSWKDLGYAVTNGKTTTQILQNLNGLITPGSVVAILGASGAGKSTMLDLLAGRKSAANMTGEVLVNGQNVSMKGVSRYCTQEDALFGSLTVYETLLFAARFNLPQNTSETRRKQIVEELLIEFGLLQVRDTIIGTPLIKGCSGGQVRRVSVASQVIGMQTGLLFLDEPTSGLDSVAAYSVVESLKRLADDRECTVIASIHQPSTETFNLFTHILVLGQGSTVYFGKREDAIAYFGSIGHVIPNHANPSDVYLQLTNVDFSQDRQTHVSLVDELVKRFESSELNAGLIAQISSQHIDEKSVIPTSSSNGFLHQTSTLVRRSLLNSAKNPIAYWIRVAMYVALAILMGTTWWRMGTFQTKVQDRLGAIFFSVAFLSFMSVAGIPAFLEERHVFLRERANGLYGVESYILSNFLVSIPFIFIITISFSLVAYFAMGMTETASAFWVFVGYLFMALMVAEAQVVFVSVAIPIFVAALAIGAFANGLWMVVQGYFIQRQNLPPFWRYSFHYADFQKYAFEGLLKNEMLPNVFQCDQTPTGCFCLIPPANATACEFTGRDVLDFYGYTDIEDGKWVGILFAILAAFKLGTYVILKMRGTKTK